jgi:MFS transporter, ACS family, D-galactonate transporter
MPDSKPTNVRWLIVAMLVVIVFLAHFNRVSISVAGNKSFICPNGISEERMGVIYSAFLFVYTIGMLPGGWLIDRFGPRLALAGMGVGLGFCGILTGLLGHLGLAIASLYLPLLLIRGLAGASSITLHPGAARAVSLWMPLANRSTANGLVTAGALVGIAVTYPGFGWLMDRFDWPAAFMISGAALACVGVGWWILSADDASGHRWSNTAERELVAGERVAPRSKASIGEFLNLFQNRSLVLLTLSYGALSYVQYLFFYWMEYYFTKVLGFLPEESRRNAFIVTMSMALGMAFGGIIADRLCGWFGHRIGARIIAAGGMGLCAAFGLLGIATTDVNEIVLCFSLSFGSLGLCEGIFWTTAPRLAPRSGGLACALINTGGNGVGMLAPVVTPILGKYYGWNSAIIVGCIVCSIGAVLWLGILSESRYAPAV